MNEMNGVNVDPPAGLRDLFLLRPDVVFLNHGSFGACPRPVFDRYQAWQLELERQPVEFLGRRWVGLLAEARAALGRFVGADGDDLIYVPNATTGLNAVARSLPLEPGDEVLSTDHEYGALDRTWRFVCGRRGACYVRRHLSLPMITPEQVVEAVWSGVTDRTRILFLSHITSPTALVLPVAELVRRARELGIVTVIDGAHAPGQMPLDLETLGADFYAGNCHKWMMAPKGAGFLHARRSMQPLLDPLVVSWGWQPERTTLLSLDGGASPFVLENEWQGTRDLAAFLSVPAAIDFMKEHRWEEVRDGCHALLRHARRALADLTGLAPIAPDDRSWFVQMAACPLPPCDPGALKQRLLDEFHIEVPVTVWGGRALVRISVQGYNTLADLETLVAALRALL